MRTAGQITNGSKDERVNFRSAAQPLYGTTTDTHGHIDLTKSFTLSRNSSVCVRVSRINLILRTVPVHHTHMPSGRDGRSLRINLLNESRMVEPA